MDTIMIVTPRQRHFADFARGLAPETGIRLQWADSGAAALDAGASNAPLAVVIDDDLGDMPGLELVRRLLSLNAMICTALVSGLDAEMFHEATEGLGILVQLAPDPTHSEARNLLDRLSRMSALLPRRESGCA